MNCNPKRSALLKAATVYLGGQGKNHIEQFGTGGFTPGGRQTCRTAEVGLFEEGCEGTRRETFLVDRPFIPLGRAAVFPSELAQISDRKPSVSSVNPVSKRDGLVEQPVGKKPDVKEEGPVEILGVPDADGGRADRSDEATECSSSFGHSESFDVAGDEPEVQSAPRDGSNGASPSKDRRKALSMDWRTHRRNIEWRCRWIDLRIMELQRQTKKYDDILSHTTKSWDSRAEPDGGAVRTSPVPDGQTTQPLLHRHRRRKLEETVDIADHMSKHPLLQRYEKKRRENEQACVLSRDPNDLAEDIGLQDADETPAGDEDSPENLLLKIELLQARITKARNQLRGSMSHKFHGQARTTARTPKVATRPRAAAGNVAASTGVGKGAQARRRASDFDINNVVMPVSVGAKYVEHVRHANIETPQWRLVDTADTSGSMEDSGEEDTDDEAYRVRHAPFETRERANRYVPRTNKKAADGDAKSNRGGKQTSSSQAMQCSLSSQFSEG